jgi:hypothetical protein
VTELAVSEPASNRTRAKRRSSAVSSGRALFVEGDSKGPWARRWRDLISDHTSDLGGPATLSEAQRSLVKRASTIEVQLEQIEGKLSVGEDVDLAAYVAAAGGLRRILETLGITRQAKPVESLEQYLARPWPPKPVA